MNETFLDNIDYSLCCGCSACADSCPVGAISFSYGKDGAKYPAINKDVCIGCGKCRRVCPVVNKPETADPEFEKKAFALAIEPKKRRLESASGGAFEAIATVLHRQYADLMIAGAAWGDYLRVYHKLVSYDDSAVLKKSKYVQSNCEGIYVRVKEKLDEGLHVLFTGTPCQLAALKKFLNKEYDNLFLVDIICHGVPGENIFKKYLDELSVRKGTKAITAGFRQKKKDFYGEVHSKYIRVGFENGTEILEEAAVNPYLRGFHAGLFYRESCYSCRFANKNRYGDITIGDYWRIQELDKKLVDYSGVSCLLINSEKGYELLDKIDGCRLVATDVAALYKRNGQLLNPSKRNPKNEYFLSHFEEESFEKIMDNCVKREKRFKRILSGIIPGGLKRGLKRILHR